MDMAYFNYCQGLTMTAAKFAELFDGPPRKAESPITQREMDLAASIQEITEKVVLRMAATARNLTGMPNVCLAGGVALNGVVNGKLTRSGLFDRVWIQPAAGDAGGALGGALLVHYQLLDNERAASDNDSMEGSLLGPRSTNEEIRKFLAREEAPYRFFQDEADLLTKTAGFMSDGKVVGWFQNRMEFGPRALGSRSIIGDARSPEMQSKMNLRIKFRESFRPFAPCVLREVAGEYFEMDDESPYMLIVADVRKKHRRELSSDDIKNMKEPDLRLRVNVARSSIPAITHVDMSARVQTVDETRHGRFYRLMQEFKRQTGCGVIINTSFNVRGEPIVCTPEDSYQCFLATDMDVLVMENCMLLKEEQPAVDVEAKRQYVESFELD